MFMFLVWTTGHEAEFAEKLSDEEYGAGVVEALKHFLKKDDIPLPYKFVRYACQFKFNIKV